LDILIASQTIISNATHDKFRYRVGSFFGDRFSAERNHSGVKLCCQGVNRIIQYIHKSLIQLTRITANFWQLTILFNQRNNLSAQIFGKSPVCLKVAATSIKPTYAGLILSPSSYELWQWAAFLED
jgi:hypothetical protein